MRLLGTLCFGRKAEAEVAFRVAWFCRAWSCWSGRGSVSRVNPS